MLLPIPAKNLEVLPGLQELIGCENYTQVRLCHELVGGASRFEYPESEISTAQLSYHEASRPA